MKKILTLFSVAAGVLALTSCGGGKKNTFDCPEAFDTATPVTVIGYLAFAGSSQIFPFLLR